MGYMLKGKDLTPGNRTNYTYDTVGRMTKVRHYLNKQNIGDGVTFGFGYNPAGQIKSRTINNDAYAETAEQPQGLLHPQLHPQLKMEKKVEAKVKCPKIQTIKWMDGSALKMLHGALVKAP